MANRWDITKAVRRSDLSAAARLVMLVLADAADVGTAEIPPQHTPSLTVLQRETGLARSTVARVLSDLEAGGWVRRTRPATDEALGRGERTRYQLFAPDPAAPLVPQSDQAPSPTTTTPSPTVGPPLVPQSDSSTYQDQIKSEPAHAGSSGRARGTRLPTNFTVTGDMVTWARENAPDVDGRRATAAFVDYWRARPGAGGLKLDWVATWRNWMRKAQDDATRGRPRAPNGYRSQTDANIAAFVNGSQVLAIEGGAR